MRKIRFTREAAEELEQAAAWYEEECSGLGARFINATENALTLLKEDFPPLVPVHGEAGKKGVKQVLLHKFPFSLIVLPGKDEMIVVAVAHQHRRPFYWSDRINT
jgi:toxin ParE1/3/4